MFTGVRNKMSQDDEIYQKLAKEFPSDDSEKVVSITLDPAMILKADLALLRILFDKGMRGIILCTGRPAESYIKMLGSSGLNPDLLYFIDTVTFSSVKQKVDVHDINQPFRHVYYQEKQNMKLVPHPSDFTAIDVAFSKSVDELVRNKSADLFLLIDGIASHQLYIKPSALGAFIHTIVSKARTWDITTFLLLSDGIDPLIANTIKTFSDKIINL